MNADLLALAKLLAQLFLDPADADLIMAQAGINRGRVLTEQSASTRWYAIVNEAEKAGQIAALIDTALLRYPKHTELKRLKAELAPMPHFTEGCTQ